ncbi:MAG: hypothetical protein JSR85_00755 [Proteobacteria bacterium]|nr:hypothetical protein [Pseudomonadota bacterium]
MKLYKTFLLASAMMVSLLPHSISANVDIDELVEKVRFARACPAQAVKEEEPKGWFSSFKATVGKTLLDLGNSIRGEENTKTAAGKLTQQVKEGIAATASAKLHIPVSTDVVTRLANRLGNGLRTVGRWFGVQETQTPTRVILNNLELNQSAKENDIANALRTAAITTIRADVTTAPEAFREVIHGLNMRGYSTKKLDGQGIFIQALADEIIAGNTAMSYNDFRRVILVKGLEALEGVTSVKASQNPGDKTRVMEDFLQKVYQYGNSKAKLNQSRHPVRTFRAA